MARKGVSGGGRADDKYGGALAVLSARSGVNPRVINRILHGPSPSELDKHNATGEWVTLRIVDKLFCAMNCIHLFPLPPERGGFSDVYFHESVIDPEAWAKRRKAIILEQNRNRKKAA